jgi:ubiquinone/menaquinone biosynthesis C-methylase UbiE
MNNGTIIELWEFTGLWAYEMSQEFPNASIVGLDLTPPAKHHPFQDEGFLYVQGDVHKELAFTKNAFDFVYQRDMATFIPRGRWMQLIQEFSRVLKPGGWLQLVEYGMIQMNGGPCNGDCLA